MDWMRALFASEEAVVAGSEQTGQVQVNPRREMSFWRSFVKRF